MYLFLFTLEEILIIEDDKIDEKEYEKICGDRHNVRSCDLDYVARLINAGFQLIHDVKMENINSNKIKYFGLITNHIAWICEKSETKV